MTEEFRIGSMCSGYGGLDLAALRVFGGQVVWHAEYDSAASATLARHWPTVPNLGDITYVDDDRPGQMLMPMMATDWHTLPPVELLCAGYPCQPFSGAGRRKGTDDERHIWPYIAETIRRVRPGLILLENVAGHRSLGFGAVLADLAQAGYVGSWVSVKASDVGAPHVRERVFILAADATRLDAADAVREAGHVGPGLRAGGPPGIGWGRSGDGGGEAVADADDQRHAASGPLGSGAALAGAAGGRRPAADASGGDRAHIPARGDQPGAPLSPVVGAGDGDRAGTAAPRVRQLGRVAGVVASAAADPAHERREVGGARDHDQRGEQPGHVVDGRDADAADPDSDPVWVESVPYAGRGGAAIVGDPGPREWGKYGPAIHRWEHILGRAAPAPTELNSNGGQRLAAPFVEWMMGLPAGWVTGDRRLSRNAQLRLLGNGVVPAQAELALWLLLEQMTGRAAA